MNSGEARAILGISSGATIGEARKAHRDLAKVFHPDRHSAGAAEDTRRANQAMAQINQALDVLMAIDKNGFEPFGANTATNKSQSTQYIRPARRDECHLCGFQPATQATFRAYAGVLIWISSRRFEGAFCRLCAQTLFREMQSINLTRGWWGLSVFPMVFALGTNTFNWIRIRKIGMPLSRDPSVATPLIFPAPPTRPVFLRPTVWIASVMAMLILVVWLGAALGPPEGAVPTTSTPVPTSDIEPPDTEAIRMQILMKKAYDPGSCWSGEDSDGTITPVFCNDFTAEFEVSTVVSDDSRCPRETIGTVITQSTALARSGQIACLRLLN